MWFRTGLAGLCFATVVGCGKATAPTDSSLTGRWNGTVGGLGIGFVTLDLTEDNKTVAGTGTWTPQTGGTQATLTVQGLHFGLDIQLSLNFAKPTGTETLVLPGTIETANSFHLLFPTDPTPTKVIFSR
jgi:hypothetical protein